MRRGLVSFLAILLLLANVYASCEEGQIDINSASLEELDNLSGIGPAYANEIINSRPFSSVDELIDVKGIGEVTLDKIKTQGLACVDNEEDLENEEESEKEADEEEEESEENDEEIEIQNIVYLSENKSVKRETISLNSEVTKDIKIKENEESNNINYPLWGLILFSVLIGALLLINRRQYKNEFKK
jgi:competence ComEA-like helix-hairpin-helix protein